MAKEKKWYVADFETTSERFYNENGYTKVWLYSICDSEANVVRYGYSIEDFFDYCYKNLLHCIVYFHNLKFDGSFILNYLFNNGYTYKDNLKARDKKGFSTLIGEMGEYYQIKVNFSSNRNIVFADSLKLLPFKVEKIAKDFNLPIRKLKIDYDDYTITQEKLEYIAHDVRIVAMALKVAKGEGMIKMTTASSAYHYFWNMLNFSVQQIAFPELDTDFLVAYRQAYRGGRSMVNPRWQGKILRGVKRYDINSMYPYIMHDCWLPYGNPIKLDKPNQYRFELYKIEIGFTLKKGHLPSLLKKGALFNLDSTYYYETEGVEIMYISNIDLELVQRNYDVYYLKYIEIYGFNTTDMLFKAYVDHFYNLKNKSVGALRTMYKLFLNSLYGKFGTKIIKCCKIPKLENEHLAYEKDVEKEGKHYYLPMAIAITSYAHKLLDDAIYLSGVDNFVYCDTDSVHTFGELPKEMVDQKELGKFKLEAVEDISKYVRQKTYVTKDNDGITITCAGMNDDLKEKVVEEYGENIFNIFDVGFKVNGKLLPKQVKGGTILHESTFEII